MPGKTKVLGRLDRTFCLFQQQCRASMVALCQASLQTGRKKYLCAHLRQCCPVPAATPELQVNRHVADVALMPCTRIRHHVVAEQRAPVGRQKCSGLMRVIPSLRTSGLNSNMSSWVGIHNSTISDVYLGTLRSVCMSQSSAYQSGIFDAASLCMLAGPGIYTDGGDALGSPGRETPWTVR